MKRSNRLFAILLAVAMVVTYMPAMVFAGTESEHSWKLEQNSSEYRVFDDVGEVTLEATLDMGEGDLSYSDVEYRWTAGEDEVLTDWAMFTEEGLAEWTTSEPGTYTLEAKEVGETSASNYVSFNVRTWNTPAGGDVALIDGSATLDATVSADYEGNFTYQWMKNNMETNEYETINGATESVLSIDAKGDYKCVVKETVGEQTYTNEYAAYVYAEGDDAWWIDCDDTDILLENGSATLACIIDEDNGFIGDYLFKWQEWDDENEKYVPISGENSESITVDKPGEYRCYVKETNTGGEDCIVFHVDSWQVDAKNDKIYLLKGETGARLELTFKGEAPSTLTYQWFVMDDNETPTPIEGEKSTTLNVGKGGDYLCRVYYGSGIDDWKEVAFEVIEHERTWRASAKEKEVEIKAGKTALLELRIEGTYDEANIRYQWFNRDYDSEEEPDPIVGATGPSYEATDEGYYHCKIWESGAENYFDVASFHAYTETIVESGVTYYPLKDHSAAVYGDDSVKGEVSIKPSVVFSDGEEYPVSTVDEYGFEYCERMTSVSIPTSISVIGEYAFFGTGIKSITIPESVNTIGDYAVGYAADEEGDRVLIPDFVIKGYANSEAQKYAEANGIDFEIIGSEDDQDEIKANEVSALINALPAGEDVTIADKEDIEAARAAYNKLTDKQKALVSEATTTKLLEAEAALKDAEDAAAADEVVEMINALPENVTTADKDAIQAARAAYDALTKDQKNMIGVNTEAKLTEAEAALKAAEDAEAAAPVIAQINALPTTVAISDKTAIEAARAAYDALTNDQKAKVSEEVLGKLTTAEAALKDAEDEAAADAVVEIINALPETVTTADKADIEAARAAYDALTDAQKAKVSEAVLNKLTAAETSLREAEDTAAADAVIAKINALPDDVTTNDKADIEAARAAYDALTDAQKAKVSEAVLNKLTAAETSLKEAVDTAAADAVAAKINALPENVTTADKAAIEAARKAYNDLTEDQKAKIDADTLAKLTVAETELDKAQKEADRRAEEARKAAQPKEIVDLPVVKISKPKAGKKKATVKWKKVSKKNQKKIQGIEIQVASDPGFKQIVKSTTASKKKKSKTIKGLRPKTTYWVRIRAYKNASNGKHVSAWKVKKVKIKK